MSHTVGGPADHAQGGQTVRQHDPRKARRALIGAYVGTSLEWYDFFLFGTTSSIVFAPLFFGGDDPALAVISSFLLFGVGFIARPVGALLAGHFGDRLGRPARDLRDHRRCGTWAPLDQEGGEPVHAVAGGTTTL